MNPSTSPMDGWETQHRDTLDRALAATPAQRLRWLEEAIAFAFRAGALPIRGAPEEEREELP